MAMVKAGWGYCALLVSIGTLPLPSQVLPAAARTKVDFARDIEPLLKRCQVCHGAQQQMSGFRVDQKEAALKGGALGKDIQPGNSAGSRLIRLVAGVDGKVMPPMGARLTAAEVGLLRAWIDQGRDWPAPPTAPGAIIIRWPTACFWRAAGSKAGR